MNINDDLIQGRAVRLAFEKIESCIFSAKSVEHFQTCMKMTEAMETLYHDHPGINGMARELRRFIQTRSEDFGYSNL